MNPSLNKKYRQEQLKYIKKYKKPKMKFKIKKCKKKFKIRKCKIKNVAITFFYQSINKRFNLKSLLKE